MIYGYQILANFATKISELETTKSQIEGWPLILHRLKQSETLRRANGGKSVDDIKSTQATLIKEEFYCTLESLLPQMIKLLTLNDSD